MKKFPNLIVIGAMKSGTTSLHNYLSLHPDIFMSQKKEIDYYTDAIFKKETQDWYLNQFDSDYKVRGESSQNYSKCHNKYYQNIPKRIKNDIPNVKFIYLLRDPIERYKSQISENYYGETKKEIEYNIKSENYLKTSMYYMQLTEYLKYFSIDQFLIITTEELNNNRLYTMNKIFNFLGVDEIKEENTFNFISNDNKGKKVFPLSFKQTLIYKLIKKGLPKKVFQKIEYSSFLRNYIFIGWKKREIDKNEIIRIKSILVNDIDKLRKTTNLEFKDWKI
ncbi:sulfotransferase family protein [Flammeovirga agarivorans]|uniref:Sulfotransferase n=1 Tax=Flammeovirga agarivorans TaxID=2726742 RepID=A0A7X8SHT6_9BACT|nr:sulfotransferase [Flammeovirga agarivorans]NLR90510.1 sulfotransferase [Flammeovirga agarivorans]